MWRHLEVKILGHLYVKMWKHKNVKILRYLYVKNVETSWSKDAKIYLCKDSERSLCKDADVSMLRFRHLDVNILRYIWKSCRGIMMYRYCDIFVKLCRHLDVKMWRHRGLKIWKHLEFKKGNHHLDITMWRAFIYVQKTVLAHLWHHRNKSFCLRLTS